MLKVGEIGPLSKGTQFSHCLSLRQEPPEKKGAQHSRVVSSAVGDQALYSPGWCYNSRSALTWEGVWVFSRLSCLPGRLNPTGFHQQMLIYAGSSFHHCCSVLGILLWVTTPRSWGKGVSVSYLFEVLSEIIEHSYYQSFDLCTRYIACLQFV